MEEKKTQIFKAGRELFYANGFKKVNVSDITKLAGVGTGTFYNYYSSKEQLFLDIYIMENAEAKHSITDNLDLDADPVSVAEAFVAQSMEVVQTNLILKEWYNRDIFSELEEHYRAEEGGKDYFIRDFYTRLLEKWRKQGKLREDIEDDVVLALFDSLVYLDTHKEEIGTRHFPQMIQLLIEFIVKGLTDK